MIDLKIDPTTWDLALADNGVDLVEDLEEVRQRVGVGYKTHLGEWTFDTDLGLPWADEILVKAPDLEQITARIRAFTIGIQDVTKIISLGVDYDASARSLQLDPRIDTIFGSTETTVTVP